MSNEVNDIIVAEAISSLYGAPKRYRSASHREIMRDRPHAFYDFENGIVGTPFTDYLVGLSTIQSNVSTPNHTNVRLSLLGSGATPRAAIHCLSSPTSAQGSHYYGNNSGRFIFECGLKINNLATAAEDYMLRVGMINRADNATGSLSMVGFEYDRASSTSWRCRVSRSGSGGSGIGPTVSTDWTVLRFEVNQLGNQVLFYVNDSLEYTYNSAPVPNTPATSTSMVIAASMKASAGSVAKTFDIDWVSYDWLLTTPR